MNSRNASAFDLGQRSLAPKPKQLVVLADKGYNLKMKIQDLGFNNQILVINASLLGKKADDLNSFTNRLLKYSKIAIYCPQGSGTLRQQLLMMH